MTVRPIFLLSDVMTVQRAGMLTPAANVSVANTTYTHRAKDGGEELAGLLRLLLDVQVPEAAVATLTRLALKSSSTRVLYTGSRPAWWLAMPCSSRRARSFSNGTAGFDARHA